jgi:hypothetical protein
VKLNDDDINYLKKIIEKSDDGIKNVGLFLTLFSGGYKKDPVPLLQLALAIIHDKPIALVVLDDEPVPENIKKIAMSIEYVKRGDQEGMKKAVEKIHKLVEKLDREQDRNVH